jgi:hypothetical protein
MPFLIILRPVTVAERCEAYTVSASSEAGIVGSNPTQGIDVWYVYVFIACLCLRPLEHWDRGLESHSKYGCLCASILFVLFCV